MKERYGYPGKVSAILSCVSSFLKRRVAMTIRLVANMSTKGTMHLLEVCFESSNTQFEVLSSLQLSKSISQHSYLAMQLPTEMTISFLFRCLVEHGQRKRLCSSGLQLVRDSICQRRTLNHTRA
jgi:hypothetical protein